MRTLLAATAIALAAFDGWWSYAHFLAPNADITYAGLDSQAAWVPSSKPPARFVSGKWDIGPVITLDLEMMNGRNPRDVALVTLAPELTFGKAIAVIRDLKNRQVCNLLIRDSEVDGGRLYSPIGSGHDEGTDQDEVAILSLVLCGYSIGDAGWNGPLPPDRQIHVTPQTW